MAREPDGSEGRERPALTGQRPPGAGWTRYEPGGKRPDDQLGIERRRGTRHEDGRRRRRRGRLLGYLLVAFSRS